MRPEHWTAGDVTKLEQITEEGRLTLIDLIEFYVEDRDGIKEESAIAVDQILEALGAEGHEFT